MLPLAEWVMRGRSQAFGLVLICLATSPIVWPNSIIGTAILGLVWLRHGSKEGSFLWFWALLPCAAIAVMLHQFTPLLLICTISVTCWVLRSTASFNYALLASTACCFIATIGIDQLAVAQLEVYVEALEDIINAFQQQAGNAKTVSQVGVFLADTLGTSFVAGIFGATLVISHFISLALARSWQAKLYNPGGFQQEFHKLRLNIAEVVVLTLLSGLLISLGKQYITWVWVGFFPALIAGIALFHAIALSRKMSAPWYIVFYVVLLFWDLFKIALVIIALIDSLIDIRSKISSHAKIDSDS